MNGGITMAHGVGRVYESPLPVWLYLVGAGATVMTVLMSLFTVSTLWLLSLPLVTT